MSEKRFECVFVEDEYGGHYKRLKDNETGIAHMTCDVVDLLNFQNTQIKILQDENEQLRQAEKINEEYAEQIISENKKLRIAKNDLRKENEQLKSQQKWTEETLQKKLIIEIKPDFYGWRANVKELEDE